MADFKMQGIDDLINELKRYEDVDSTALKMVDAASPIMKNAIVKGIEAVTDRGYSNGDLVESVKTTRAKINNYGVFALVRVTGTDRRGMRNGEKMAYLEYGTSKQNARPVMAKAVKESEPECVRKMQEIFDQETK